MTIKLESADELKELVMKAENLLVYFFNNDCAPCLALRPKVETLITERFPLMDLVYIDAKQFPELISEYQAYSFPVLIFFFEGKEYDGSKSFSSLKRKVRESAMIEGGLINF